PSPSPSPAPGQNAPPNNLKPINTRASLQPPAVPRTPSGQQQVPISPRPLGINNAHGRPTSELLNPASNVAFQTPEVDAIDQWFENLQNYETTLEEMAAASLDVNFKEELGAIEQWFRVLSEAERTAALYSLLQHSTQMQIRFFITVLQQMARSDPMTALLSPNVGASMQSQMEAKLASIGLKSPGLPASPSARTFGSSLARQSMTLDNPNFLSPESANTIQPANSDPAATLAHQRAKLKANAAHRISAPGTLAQFSENPRNGNVWPSSQLGLVAERAPSPTRETSREAKLSPPLPTPGRPKSIDFSTVANSFRSPRVAQVQGDQKEDPLSPMIGGNWASMVNTPVNPMFAPSNTTDNAGRENMDAASVKLAAWNLSNNSNSRVVLDDPRKFRRVSAAAKADSANETSTSTVYGDDGEPLHGANGTAPASRPTNGANTAVRGPAANSSAASMNNLQNSWGANNPRSPALSSTRFGSEANESLASAGLNFAAMNGPMSAQAQAQALAMAQMGMNMPGFNMFGGGLALNPMQVQQAQAQLFAQLAANGYNPAAFGLGGLQPPQQQRGSSRAGGRSPSNRGGTSANGRGGGDGKDKDEEVDISLLGDIPGWLRSLRLHKYTPNFEGSTWKEMVVMDEAKLEAKGVAALGARRKLLKTFEAVRAKMGIPDP
ncbi:hypothetical protein DL93DRAFT_2029071, partial [Clavulina sp. PMI_390]